MAIWVIKRVSDGWYIAPGGLHASYTPALQHARGFVHQAEAQQHCRPQGEVVVLAEEEITGYQPATSCVGQK